MRMRRKKSVLFEIFTTVVLIIVIAVCFDQRAEPLTYQNITEIDASTKEKIQNVIVWNTDFSQEIEDSIVANLGKLPENILDSWLAVDGHITVCPSKRGYLDIDDDFISDTEEETDYYTIAYNAISVKNKEIIGSNIHILGSAYYIQYSLLHELGHYVYYAYFGTDADYELPNYETDSMRFTAAERNCTAYLLTPDEYFADIFAYVISNGTTEKYPDTFILQEIINNF